MPRSGRGPVLYWAQSSLRAGDNPALAFAAGKANEMGLPLLAFYSMDPSIQMANERNFTFMLKELENGETGDELWDASQYEMVKYGKMAGYMRMYWGKRVIEWAGTPEEALRYLLYLNDKYEIDGRSPNGYAGILWCFGKHDRAFVERPVYGKLRYMSPSGIKKKFSVPAYIKKSGFNERAIAYV